ncbi:hypothetical protein LEMLEM_LOCUS15830, partial [Lemmus lemmus]
WSLQYAATTLREVITLSGRDGQGSKWDKVCVWEREGVSKGSSIPLPPLCSSWNVVLYGLKSGVLQTENRVLRDGKRPKMKKTCINSKVYCNRGIHPTTEVTRPFL